VARYTPSTAGKMTGWDMGHGAAIDRIIPALVYCAGYWKGICRWDGVVFGSCFDTLSFFDHQSLSSNLISKRNFLQRCCYPLVLRCSRRLRLSPRKRATFLRLTSGLRPAHWRSLRMDGFRSRTVSIHTKIPSYYTPHTITRPQHASRVSKYQH
jgi:hypothetical protein